MNLSFVLWAVMVCILLTTVYVYIVARIEMISSSTRRNAHAYRYEESHDDLPNQSHL